MKDLTDQQLELIPWNRKFAIGPDVPSEPSIVEIPILLSIPFLHRDIKFSLFYTWSEIVKMVGEGTYSVLDTGCGRGQLCQILKFHGHAITGSDIDNIFCADKNIPFVHPNFHILGPVCILMRLP